MRAGAVSRVGRKGVKKVSKSPGERGPCLKMARIRVFFKVVSHDIFVRDLTSYRGSRLFPRPIVPHALSIFSIIAVFIGIPSGSLYGGESLSSA